jgi:hypothetical protein
MLHHVKYFFGKSKNKQMSKKKKKRSNKPVEEHTMNHQPFVRLEGIEQHFL